MHLLARGRFLSSSQPLQPSPRSSLAVPRYAHACAALCRASYLHAHLHAQLHAQLRLRFGFHTRICMLSMGMRTVSVQTLYRHAAVFVVSASESLLPPRALDAVSGDSECVRGAAEGSSVRCPMPADAASAQAQGAAKGINQEEQLAPPPYPRTTDET